jgi:hypothetical protein
MGFIKVFLLGWGSTLIFWAAALFFCFIGSEVALKYWKRKLLIGAPFFVFFLFIVYAFGVPKYFVYDHVEPKMLNGEPYYPAVKNHIIFQGPSFKTYGVISKDLKEFKSEESYFSSFGEPALKDYPSVSGIKSWINEIALICYFFLWLFLINKLHNASAATALYKEALKANRLANYQSYLNASQAIRFLQPFKRRNARSEFQKIRQIYIQSLNTLLLRLANQGNASSRLVLLYLSEQLRRATDSYPVVSAKGHIEDVTTASDIEAHEKGIEYDRSYFKPEDSELSTALSNSVARTLNQFLPEVFLKGNDNDDNATIKINCTLGARLQSSTGLKDSDGKASLVAVFGRLEKESDCHTFIMRNSIYSIPPTFKKGQQADSRKYCANKIAQIVTNDTLFSNSTLSTDDSANADVVKAKLKDIEAKQSRLFDAIIDECKSTTRDAVLTEAVAYALKNNEVLVDSVMSEMHQLLAENTNVYSQIIAQEVVGGLLEGIAEVASE